MEAESEHHALGPRLQAPDYRDPVVDVVHLPDGEHNGDWYTRHAVPAWATLDLTMAEALAGAMDTVLRALASDERALATGTSWTETAVVSVFPDELEAAYTAAFARRLYEGALAMAANLRHPRPHTEMTVAEGMSLILFTLQAGATLFHHRMSVLFGDIPGPKRQEPQRYDEFVTKILRAPGQYVWFLRDHKPATWQREIEASNAYFAGKSDESSDTVMAHVMQPDRWHWLLPGDGAPPIEMGDGVRAVSGIVVHGKPSEHVSVGMTALFERFIEWGQVAVQGAESEPLLIRTRPTGGAQQADEP